MSQFEQQAAEAYRAKDYEKAIRLYDRAIGRLPSVRLYDNRAGCYLQLNDLPAALKDAKRTIRLAQEDPTGYLRAGQILLKMDKRDPALDIYNHGMKHVKHEGKRYELLKNAHAELLAKIAPPKSCDPMTKLPREMAEHVLKGLSFQQLMKACLVSKQWMLLIRSMPGLWHHLDFSHAKHNVKVRFISSAPCSITLMCSHDTIHRGRFKRG